MKFLRYALVVTYLLVVYLAVIACVYLSFVALLGLAVVIALDRKRRPPPTSGEFGTARFAEPSELRHLSGSGLILGHVRNDIRPWPAVRALFDFQCRRIGS